ncbi:MAG TPA: peptide deformylase [Polyangia bacterium]|nr:peptide deformylase [Polyangia bacterium]
MALLEIVIYPNIVLKTAAVPVQLVDDSIRKLVDDMAETMYVAPGVGLAANQVGVLARVAVVDVEYSEGRANLVELINPKIVERDGDLVWEEGCLSFPGVNVEVPRSATIRLTALDRDGRPFELRAEGLLAVAIQHEIDHLDGVTLADKVSFLKRRMIVRDIARHCESRRAIAD